MDDSLQNWLRVRRETDWCRMPEIPGPFRRGADGHRHFLETVVRARDPQRAITLHTALDQVREDVSRRSSLNFQTIQSWQQIVLCDQRAPFRRHPAYAKRGREKYSYSDQTETQFIECLDQANSEDLSLPARAARLYLDVLFFHPFENGNGRSAALCIDFILLRGGVILDEVRPVLMMPRFADDGAGAWALVKLLKVLINRVSASRKAACSGTPIDFQKVLRLPLNMDSPDKDQPVTVQLRGKSDPPTKQRSDSDPEGEEALGPGAQLGRYIIEEKIGEGGMGVVYAGRDPELARKVALKILHAKISGSRSGGEFKARLMREAQAMARISHPNVVSVYDVGSLGKRIFVAMEFIDGTTLKKWLRSTQHGWREILEVFLQAGQGLAAAHQAGLIHRDFKPDNVLVSKQGRICVTDFGLVRNLPNVIDVKLPLTLHGAIMGTPNYMAPEQMVGSNTDVRTDQFSFCVALYEALFGKRPFQADTLEQLAAQIREGRLSTLPPDSQVPDGVYRALIRGLKSDASARFESMDVLLKPLREALLPAPSESGGRHRVRRALTALTVATLILSAVIWYSHRRIVVPLTSSSPVASPGPLRISVLPFKNLSGNAALEFLKEGLAEAVITDFGKVPGIELVERNQINLDLKEIDFEQTKYVDPSTRVELGKIVGAEYVVLGGYQHLGNSLRAYGRVVQVQTGEIIDAFKIETPSSDAFALQDALTHRVRQSISELKSSRAP